MSSRRRTGLALVLCASAASGCFQTRIHSGAPPDTTPEAYASKWHHGYLLDIVEGSGPHALHVACPDGWAEIETSVNPYQSLLHLVTSEVYAPQDVTIVCAAPPGASPPPPDL